MKKILIGARGSKLSLAYAQKVKNLLIQANKGLEILIDIKTISTTGDKKKDVKLSKIGGKNLFCKEIEEKLLNDEITIAVHSLKDMDSNEKEGLEIGSYIKRNDPRDVFLSNNFKKLNECDEKSVIGTSSFRRKAQAQLLNNKLIYQDIRGNIDTRISKLKNKEFDGIILAYAGLISLNLQKEIKQIFTIDEMLPSIGQGIIAVQYKKNNEDIFEILQKINHKDTEFCATAEREMLKIIGGDCATAVGGLATIVENKIFFKCQLFSDDGTKSFFYELEGEKVEAKNIGKEVGTKLLEKAGNKFKGK
jgi:hydroxymethylbilane synthase